MSPRAILLPLAMVIAGCAESFNPTTTGPRPLVVFAVLQAASDTQTVRVHQTMEPNVGDPQPLPAPGAVVTIGSSSGSVVFQPVDLPGEPGTTAATIPAFRAAPFVPVRGATYTLSVSTPSGVATGTTVVPDYHPDAVSVQNVLLLEDPSRYESGSAVIISAVLSAQTMGLAIRLFIEFEVFKGTTWVRERREVPKTYVAGASDTLNVPVYPNLVRRTSVSGSSLRQRDVATFSNWVYGRVLKSIVRDYPPAAVRTLNAVVILHQADRHFFTYYTYANHFQDRFSIRLDQPDYTNMTGALGVFGSLTTDTLSLPLPPDVHTR
jgi:hypothetical protein